jgi:hypothetical protein
VTRQSKNYKNSKLRLVLLLAQLLGIVYTLLGSDDTARILAFLLLPLWIYSARSWYEV